MILVRKRVYIETDLLYRIINRRKFSQIIHVHFKDISIQKLIQC